ncbi:MAG: barstar family protein [Planctomycetota bacterium]|nr:barstar family protein [Planctomycetota bacterium]
MPPQNVVFEFVDALPQDHSNWRVVPIGPGVRSKEKLLARYQQSLEFPPYFGENWDALEECLLDLSWLPKSGVLIWHQSDAPLGRLQLPVYLDLLQGVIQKSRGTDYPVRVLFPTSAQQTLQR